MTATTSVNPLHAVARRHVAFTPLVAALGVAASLLDWVSVGALVPWLMMILTGPDLSLDGMPGPIALVFRFVVGIPESLRAWFLGGTVLALLILRAVVQASNSALIGTIQSRFIRDIQVAIAHRLTRVDYAFFLREDSARLIQIFNAFSWAVGDAVRAGLTLIPALTGLVVIGFLLIWLDWRLALLVGASAAAIYLVLHRLQRWQQRLDEDCTAHVKEQGRQMIQLVTALRVIRIFGQQQREEDRFAHVTGQVYRKGLAWHAVSALILPTVSAGMAVVFVAVIMLAGPLGVSGPALVAFVILLARVEPYASMAGQARNGMKGVEGRMREVEWLLSQPVFDVETVLRGEPCESLDQPLRFDAVSFAYGNGHLALDQAMFTIEPGVATALIGPSGAGKTTVVNLLCRLIEPTSGTICHGQKPAGEIDPRQWRERIAVAGQDLLLVDGTVAENIAYGRPDASREEIEEVATIAGASGFIAVLPGGFDAQVGYQGSSLSGGQRQRIGLARALLRRPDLLILDEATNAVDALSENEIVRLLASHSHFRTALVISHRSTTLSACTNGIVIQNGKVIATGPLADLPYYRHMMGE